MKNKKIFMIFLIVLVLFGGFILFSNTVLAADLAPEITQANVCTKLKTTMQLIHIVIVIIKITVPIILIVMGMIDLTKAVVVGDEKAMKESQSHLLKRIVYALVIFFVVTAVQVVYGLISQSPNNSCWNCAITGCK